METNTRLLFTEDAIRIILENISTTSKVGIWEHELISQPIRIDLEINASLAIFPNDIQECINYDPICNWLTHEFPNFPHTELLETRMLEIFDFIFRMDQRIKSATISIFKTKAFNNIDMVGINKTMTREALVKTKFKNQINCREIDLTNA